MNGLIKLNLFLIANNSMCNTFISGATGKVGKILVEKVLEDSDLILSGGSASKGSKSIGKDLGDFIGKPDINISVVDEKTIIAQWQLDLKENLIFPPDEIKNAVTKKCLNGNRAQLITFSSSEGMAEATFKCW